MSTIDSYLSEWEAVWSGTIDSLWAADKESIVTTNAANAYNIESVAKSMIDYEGFVERLEEEVFL